MEKQIDGINLFTNNPEIKKNIQNLHGFYLFGKIEGVDFTVEGKLQDGTKYGNSLKLKFAQATQTTKELNGISVPVTVFKSQTIVINCDTKDELSKLVSEYSSKVGKDVVIELNIPDNQRIKTLNISTF